MVSIIVPVYNAEKYLLETITMVKQQTYGNWELILVDDCSLDGSVQVVKACLEECPDSRIRLIVQEENRGAAAARNRGLEEASGRYIAFLDADDVWMPDKLKIQMEYMEEKQVSFVFSAYEFGDEMALGTGKVVHVPKTLSYSRALSRTVIFTSTVLLDSRKIPKELMMMPQVASEDTATWWQILRKGYVAHGIDQVLAVYRRPRESLSSNKLKAIRRIWFLYRKVEKLPLMLSCLCFVGWAWRATVRRI